MYPGQEIKTEEAFREKLREEIGKYWKQEATKPYAQRSARNLWCTKHRSSFLKIFLKRWLQKGGENPKTAEEADKEYPSFDHQLRWTLISDKLIRDNSSGSFLRGTERKPPSAKIMGYYGLGGEQAEWLDSYLERLLQDEKYCGSDLPRNDHPKSCLTRPKRR